MPNTQHEWTVSFYTNAGLPIITMIPLEARMTLDETWSPYGQFRGRFVIPDLNMLQYFDPAQENPPYVEVNLTRSNPPGTATTKTFDLWIRTFEPDFKQNEFTITAETGECLLQDYVPAGSATHTTYPSLDTDDAVDYTIDLATRAGGVYTFASTLPSGGITLDSGFIWKRGVSAWDMVSAAAEANDARLWGNPQSRTVFHLEPAPVDDANPSLLLEDVIDFQFSKSRDGDGWADAVTVQYRWTDASDVAKEKIDRALAVATTADVWKTVFVTRSAPYPGPGAAAGILSRIRGRAAQNTVTAISDYNVVTGREVQLDRGDDKWGFPSERVRSVEWAWPLNRMTITTRGA